MNVSGGIFSNLPLILRKSLFTSFKFIISHLNYQKLKKKLIALNTNNEKNKLLQNSHYLEHRI